MLKKSTMGNKASTPVKRKAEEISESGGPTKVVIAIDIESGGTDMIRHPLLAVGWYVCELGKLNQPLEAGYVCPEWLTYIDQSTLESMANLSPGAMLGDVQHGVHRQEFEKACLEDFWHNEEKCPGGREHLAKFAAEVVPHRQAMQQIRDLIDRYDDGTEYEAVLISDNTTYDFGWLDYHLSKEGLRRVHIRSNDRYRRVFDTVDYRRGLFAMDHGKRQYGERWIIEQLGLEIDPLEHNHTPDSDARYINMFYHHMLAEAECRRRDQNE